MSSVAFAPLDSTHKPTCTWYGVPEPLKYHDDDQRVPFEANRLFQDEDKIREAAEIAIDPFSDAFDLGDGYGLAQPVV